MPTSSKIPAIDTQNLRKVFGDNVAVAYFGGANYTVSWGRHDFGSGFLKADTAMLFASLYNFLFSLSVLSKGKHK